MSCNDDLGRLFNPRSIAVVGAGADITRGATGFLDALVKMEFPGAIHPIHPHLPEVMGLKARSRLVDVAGPVDYAIIGVPAQSVPGVIEDCIAKEVPFIHIFTSGFEEVGTREGAVLQKKLVEMARGRVRLIGPNCMGIYHPRARIAFDADHPREGGNVSFISQSGGLAGSFVDRLTSENLFVNKLVSIGNACDLKPNDFIEYFSRDEDTAMVGMYLEGLAPGGERTFVRLVQKMTARKPLVLWKAGYTDAGARAAMSHTGSMVGSYILWRSIVGQIGVILVGSMEEMVDVMSLYARAPLPRGNNLGVVAFGGGTSVTTTDTCTSNDFAVPALGHDIQDKILEYIPAEGTFRSNPVDVTGWMVNPRVSRSVSLLVGSDPQVHALVHVLDIDFLFRRCLMLDLDLERMLRGHTKSLVQIKETIGKPVLSILQKTKDDLELEKVRLRLKAMLNDSGIPSFPSIQRAAQALSRLRRYAEYLRAHTPRS